jgi:hypothetical protein
MGARRLFLVVEAQAFALVLGARDANVEQRVNEGVRRDRPSADSHALTSPLRSAGGQNDDVAEPVEKLEAFDANPTRID